LRLDSKIGLRVASEISLRLDSKIGLRVASEISLRLSSKICVACLIGVSNSNLSEINSLGFRLVLLCPG
jgi:hypothetical protein